MSATPRLTGRVSEPIRQRPQVLDYTAILERDLESQQETINNLRLRVRALTAQVEQLQAEKRARIRRRPGGLS